MAARRLPTVYGRRRGDDAGQTRLIHPGVRSIDTYKDPLLCCRISCDVSPPTSGSPHCPFLASPPHNTLLSPPSSCIIHPEREREMRSPDPMLPSITFVLSQAQPTATTRGSKRWGKLGVRRTKSSPSFAPHPPRYPPRLDSDFLTVSITFFSHAAAPPFLSFFTSAPIENLIFFPSSIVTRARRR